MCKYPLLTASIRRIFGRKDALKLPNASAVSSRRDGSVAGGTTLTRKFIGCFVGSLALVIACISLQPTRGNAATYTVNTYLNSDELSKDLIAATTNQYVATVKPGLLPNMFSITVTGKNPSYQPPSVSTSIITLDAITRQLTTISTWTYVYGWADGREYTRDEFLNQVGRFAINCSSASYFGVSTTTWNQAVCTQTVFALYDYLNYEVKIPTVPVIKP